MENQPNFDGNIDPNNHSGPLFGSHQNCYIHDIKQLNKKNNETEYKQYMLLFTLFF